MSDRIDPRDPDEVLAAWLDEGPTRLPGQTRRAIAVSLPTTPQRRSLVGRSWRSVPMSTFAKLGAGAAALAVLLAGGAFLLGPGRSAVGGPAGTATPGATPVSVLDGPLVTATADACTLTGLDAPLSPDAGLMLALRNETDVDVRFQTTAPAPGSTLEEVQAYFVAEHERSLAGEALLGPPTIIDGGASREVLAGGSSELLLPSLPGTYGVACVQLDGEGRPIDALLAGPFEVAGLAGSVAPTGPDVDAAATILTVVATDARCTADPKQLSRGPLPPGTTAWVSVVNDSARVVFFELGRADDGVEYEEFRLWTEDEHERAINGQPLVGPPDAIERLSNRFVQPGATDRFLAPTLEGTYGIACIPHADDVAVDAFLVGPLRVAP